MDSVVIFSCISSSFFFENKINKTENFTDTFSRLTSATGDQHLGPDPVYNGVNKTQGQAH